MSIWNEGAENPRINMTTLVENLKNQGYKLYAHASDVAGQRETFFEVFNERGTRLCCSGNPEYLLIALFDALQPSHKDSIEAAKSIREKSCKEWTEEMQRGVRDA